MDCNGQVMKEWSELEERYQDMKVKDPKAAEDFRKKMSAVSSVLLTTAIESPMPAQHFQKTVEALEDEGATEKRHLSSMHQQRVMTIINIRKKSAMDCYTAALDKVPYNVSPFSSTSLLYSLCCSSVKRIEKCLEKLLRALEKDRAHTLHHYRHAAADERDALRRHLDDLAHIANQSIAMLERLPTVADRIRDRMGRRGQRVKGVATLLEMGVVILLETFPMRKEGPERFRWNGSIYITLAFAGIALLTALVVGVVLLRRHAHRPPQGFVEVEQAPPAMERSMQVNGYENPTYKYFEQHKP
ncbi:APLP2 [Cordylochernes scorpioides]|uniref:APLP2 n=1 Tax=Cordylochernes scorpioides TaxID=51811 RepID=A0ABY6KSI1_9ARAC|nr:APLP2 [Cordylochernes scorpioides]